MQVFRKMSRNILKNFETMKNDGVECHRPARVSTASKKYLFFFQILWKSSCHICLGYFSISFEKKITFYTAEILIIRRIVELCFFSYVKKSPIKQFFLIRILV